MDHAAESVVDLHDAVVVLGAFPALAGVDLRVGEGEIVLLRGPNGAGKTTLLRLCAGLVPLARGSGRVAGCDLATERDAVRARVGLLGHVNGLYADLTVAENVRFWGATVGATAGEVEAALTRMGLGRRLAAVPVSRLSAGQRRRTVLACLVARRARLWLLDEPHAGLDTAGRDELDATLRDAVGAGATVMVASHELERAGSLATRVVDVVGGQALDARPVVKRPGERRVAVTTRLTMWRTALLIAGKDLRVEARSRIVIVQVLPFAALVMVLFAFALDSDSVLQRVSPGLIWMATVFSLLIVVQRAFGVETADGALDALRAAGVAAPGIFLGKSIALAVQLLAVEVLLTVLAVVLYRAELDPNGFVLLVTTVVAATCGLAFVGTLYGGLAAGAKGRETLLPLLLFPVVAPVLIGATRATEAALGASGAATSQGWPWVALLAVFAALFGVGGTLAFGSLIEE